MQWKKFRSPDSYTRRISLLSGHIYDIGDNYINLPEFAWKEAYSAGCLSEDMVVALTYNPSVTQGLVEQAQIKLRVRNAILEGIEQNNTALFKKNGEPNVSKLSELLEERVSSQLVDEVWNEIQLEKL